MRYTTSLNRNFQFRRMYRSAKSKADKYLVLYYRKNRGTENHLGITVSKKVGTAVVRNRIRRLIKENYRINEEKVIKGYDFVIVARSKAAEADFYQIRSSLLSLLSSCDLEKK
ncbi:MAG: ribonuclease P protein component [Ruminococcaceae bacterium]|nr:ribonuclease P protein component [Oscillospiraceae bacterium]